MKNTILKNALMVFFMLVYTIPALAEEDPKNPPSGTDDPPAPIGDWAILLVVVAMLIGIYFYKKQQKRIINE